MWRSTPAAEGAGQRKGVLTFFPLCGHALFLFFLIVKKLLLVLIWDKTNCFKMGLASHSNYSKTGLERTSVPGLRPPAQSPAFMCPFPASRSVLLAQDTTSFITDVSVASGTQEAHSGFCASQQNRHITRRKLGKHFLSFQIRVLGLKESAQPFKLAWSASHSVYLTPQSTERQFWGSLGGSAQDSVSQSATWLLTFSS